MVGCDISLQAGYRLLSCRDWDIFTPFSGAKSRSSITSLCYRSACKSLCHVQNTKVFYHFKDTLYFLFSSLNDTWIHYSCNLSISRREQSFILLSIFTKFKILTVFLFFCKLKALNFCLIINRTLNLIHDLFVTRFF